jgi:hypothetical protein
VTGLPRGGRPPRSRLPLAHLPQRPATPAGPADPVLLAAACGPVASPQATGRGAPPGHAGWLTGSPLGGRGVLTGECGHDQFQQRPHQVPPGDQDDRVIGADVIDGPAGTGRYGGGTSRAACPVNSVHRPVSPQSAVSSPTADGALPGHLPGHDPHLSQRAPNSAVRNNAIQVAYRTNRRFRVRAGAPPLRSWPG